MKPILKYPGAKWRLADWIIEHMPPHDSYLEPFFGSGAVFFGKQKARIETINDIDGEIVSFFRVCREQPEELAEALSLTPWARDEREAAFDEAPTGAVEQARRFAVRCWMTFGAGLSKSNGWRHTTARNYNGGPDNPKIWARMPECVHAAANRLMEAQIENRPALDVIQRFDGPNVLIYADPPYVIDTLNCNGRLYSHVMSNEEHVELLRALTAHQGMVLLSGYESDMYQDLLSGWQLVTTKAQAECAASRTECLWLNPHAVERRGMMGMEGLL